MKPQTGPAAPKFIFGLLVLLPLAPAVPGAETVLEGATMGSTWTVRLPALPAGRDARSVRGDIEAVLERINAQMSTWRETSEISRFNRTPGDGWFAVSPDFAAVVAHGARISALTSGAFDITVAPLVAAWGFGPDWTPRQVPAPDVLAAARARVGWQGIEVRTTPPALRRLAEGRTLDVSAIAVGYAVDRIADVLDSGGVTDYLVDVGGEFRGRGRSAAGRPWRVGVEHPGTGSVAAAVELDAVALATSGDYRNYFEVGGRHYSHVIDPRTGEPVGHRVASVTVVAPTATDADALATALLVLGPDGASEVVANLDLAVFWVEREGDGFVTRETAAFTRRRVADPRDGGPSP